MAPVLLLMIVLLGDPKELSDEDIQRIVEADMKQGEVIDLGKRAIKRDAGGFEIRPGDAKLRWKDEAAPAAGKGAEGEDPAEVGKREEEKRWIEARTQKNKEQEAARLAQYRAWRQKIAYGEMLDRKARMRSRYYASQRAKANLFRLQYLQNVAILQSYSRFYGYR